MSCSRSAFVMCRVDMEVRRVAGGLGDVSVSVSVFVSVVLLAMVVIGRKGCQEARELG